MLWTSGDTLRLDAANHCRCKLAGEPPVDETRSDAVEPGEEPFGKAEVKLDIVAAFTK